jgi:hypothetical protein
MMVWCYNSGVTDSHLVEKATVIVLRECCRVTIMASRGCHRVTVMVFRKCYRVTVMRSESNGHGVM